MSIFTHLVSCLCSKFTLIIPTFGHHQISSKFPVFFTILSWCTHIALTSEASQGIICASFNYFHTINAPFMNCCRSDGPLNGHITQLHFLLGLFFFQLGSFFLPPSTSNISYTKAIVLLTNIFFEQANIFCRHKRC